MSNALTVAARFGDCGACLGCERGDACDTRAALAAAERAHVRAAGLRRRADRLDVRAACAARRAERLDGAAWATARTLAALYRERAARARAEAEALGA
jgi:hypothetical protein